MGVSWKIFCDILWGGSMMLFWLSLSKWVDKQNRTIISRLYTYSISMGRVDFQTEECHCVGISEMVVFLSFVLVNSQMTYFYSEACGQLRARVDSLMWWYEREYTNYSKIGLVSGRSGGRMGKWPLEEFSPSVYGGSFSLQQKRNRTSFHLTPLLSSSTTFRALVDQQACNIFIASIITTKNIKMPSTHEQIRGS